MEYEVRKAVMTDLNRIEEIYAYARSFMIKTGNPDQWGKHYPPHQQLIQDIETGTLFVIQKENVIHGVFFFYIGPDPTYSLIKDGCWRSDSSYGTIHRIAGDGSGGILKTALSYALSRISHVRIDTHHDNHVMQGAVQRVGFSKRGIIYLDDGSPRIAYDLLSE